MAFSSRPSGGCRSRGTRRPAVHDDASAVDASCTGRLGDLDWDGQLLAVVRRAGAVSRHRHGSTNPARRRPVVDVFNRVMGAVAAFGGACRTMTDIIVRNRRLLASITRVELAKRHAGSLLGMTWVVLQP